MMLINNNTKIINMNSNIQKISHKYLSISMLKGSLPFPSAETPVCFDNSHVFLEGNATKENYRLIFRSNYAFLEWERKY